MWRAFLMRRPENLLSQAGALKKTGFRVSEKGFHSFKMELHGIVKTIPTGLLPHTKSLHDREGFYFT